MPVIRYAVLPTNNNQLSFYDTGGESVGYANAMLTSGDVKFYWPVNDDDDPEGQASRWQIAVEALALGAHIDEKTLRKLGIDREVMNEFGYAYTIGLRLEEDGDMWCAIQEWATLAEHPAGFGQLPIEALANLVADMGFVADKANEGNSFHKLLGRPTESYIAITDGYWGRGNTQDEAIGNMHAAGASKKAKFQVKLNVRTYGEMQPYVTDYGVVGYFGTLTDVDHVNK